MIENQPISGTSVRSRSTVAPSDFALAVAVETSVYTTTDMRELWRVRIEPAGAGLKVGSPERLGSLPPGLVPSSIDATPDRQRFLALVPDQIGVASVTVVQHWQAAIGKR